MTMITMWFLTMCLNGVCQPSGHRPFYEERFCQDAGQQMLFDKPAGTEPKCLPMQVKSSPRPKS